MPRVTRDDAPPGYNMRVLRAVDLSLRERVRC